MRPSSPFKTVSAVMLSLVWLVVLAPVAARSVPTSHTAQGADRLPSCPPAHQPLPESFPTRAVIVSDQRAHSLGSELTASPEFAAELINEIFAKSPDAKPQVYLIASEDSFSTARELLAELNHSLSDAWLKQHLKRLTTAYPDLWLRDRLQFVTHPDGVQLNTFLNRFTSETLALGSEIREALNSVLSPLSFAAAPIAVNWHSGWAPIDGSLTSFFWNNGATGGNVVALPGGLCAIGKSDLPEEKYWQFAEQSCGGRREDIIALPSYFLSPGHADEFVKVIPRQVSSRVGDDCAFSLLIASPNLGQSLLNVHPEAPFIAPTQNRLAPHFVDIDKYYEKSPFLRNYIQGSVGYAVGKGFVPGSQILNGDVAEMLGRYPYAKARQLMQNEIDKFKADVQRRLQQRLACSVDFIEIPVLFAVNGASLGPRASTDEAAPDEPEVLVRQQTFQGLPNSINGLAFAGGAILPDPLNKAFREHIEAQFNNRGLSVRFFNTTQFGHLLSGDLHCRTLTLHACQGNGVEQPEGFWADKEEI